WAIAAMRIADDVYQAICGQAPDIRIGIAIHGEGQGSDQTLGGTAGEPFGYISPARQFTAPQCFHAGGDIAGRNRVDHPLARASSIQPEYQARLVWCTAVHPGPQAKRAMVAVQQSDAFFRKIKLWAPYQGAITVYP